MDITTSDLILNISPATIKTMSGISAALAAKPVSIKTQLLVFRFCLSLIVCFNLLYTLYVLSVNVHCIHFNLLVLQHHLVCLQS